MDELRWEIFKIVDEAGVTLSSGAATEMILELIQENGTTA